MSDENPPGRTNAAARPRAILTEGTSIETRRLIVRGFTMDDLDEISQVFGDPRVMWTEPETRTREQTETWLEGALQRYRSDGMGECAVVLRSSGRVIGDCGLVMRDIEGERMPEFNWDLRSDMWGNGYATEAARGVLSHVTRLGQHLVCALIKRQNERSRGVAMRLGMRFERRVEWAGDDWDLWIHRNGGEGSQHRGKA